MDWRTLRVAADHTHHTHDGAPAYAARFREVLKFHAPGLAPALGEDGAMHVNVAGEPAYSARFLRTFGFYEGRAAVAAAEGWHHILPDGEPLTASRFQWCGNFQDGRCTVRDQNGRYLHLDAAGAPASAARWRYAGDYRDGVAVVQREDGLHTHVDRLGQPLHGRWFVDLDVFHKGFARARDPGGWTHVDEAGQPCYARRFAAVEPFYNGQARVESLDGSLEVIDEAGATVTPLRAALRSPLAALSADLVGYWRTEAIAAAVEVGLFEALPNDPPTLAAQLGLRPDRLGALLRGLAELQLVQMDGQVWSPTPRGALLRTDHPMTLADAALEYAGPLGEAWRTLPAALRGADWSPPDTFVEVARDPTRVKAHHRMLQSYARHDYPLVPAALGLRGDERVLDVGGGVGVLAGLLLDQHPSLQVWLLDRPEVVSQVPSRPGLHPLQGDLFDDYNVAVDVAVLARVVHDWDDGRAVRLLQQVRAALPRGGQVFLVELLLPESGGFGGLCDLHLLMATGGRERTAAEYGALLATAGFELVEVRSVGALPSVLVGVAR